jgi:hypothetical protein
MDSPVAEGVRIQTSRSRLASSTSTKVLGLSESARNLPVILYGR